MGDFWWLEIYDGPPLTRMVKWVETTRTVFTPHERDLMQIKALEQAMKSAELVKVEPEVLMPVPAVDSWMSMWTHPSQIAGECCMDYLRGLTPWDLDFLKVNKISCA